MLHQALMVRRINPQDRGAVARIFAEHDATGFPVSLGVTHRVLFTHGDLYLHLVQSDQDFLPMLYAAHQEPMLQKIDGQLREYLHPVDPANPTMADSQAASFYTWTAP